MKKSNAWVRNAIKMGCAALVLSSALWTGCVTTDDGSKNAAVANMSYNQAVVEAARGNYHEASKFNALIVIPVLHPPQQG